MLGIRMLDGIVTDSVEARALSFNRDYIDVYVSSWGPSDSGRIVERPARQAATAIKEGVELVGYSRIISLGLVWMSRCPSTILFVNPVS